MTFSLLCDISWILKRISQTYLPYMAIAVRLYVHRTRNKYIASGTILVDE